MLRNELKMHGPLLSAALTLCCGCSSAPSEDVAGSDWLESKAAVNNAPSYEHYRDTARRVILGNEVFVVETDMLFDREALLKSHYDDLYVRPTAKSIINKVGGVRDKRANPTDIRYCFSAGWGQNQGTYTAPALDGVRTAIQQAMVAWQGIANVRFTYMSNLDGASCTNTGANPGVDFVVQHYADSSTAIGPFPSLAWASQKLLVPTSGISRLLAIHEIGHTIGFRHEHISAAATPRCSEGGTEGVDYESLTAFDTASVMKYANCTVSSVINGTELSLLDGVGTRLAYGPPNWWWAVLP
jgi:hypothetical protein